MSKKGGVRGFDHHRGELLLPAEESQHDTLQAWIFYCGENDANINHIPISIMTNLDSNAASLFV